MFIFIDRKSFDAIDGCVRQVREECHDNVAILIVGNKIDLQVQIYLNQHVAKFNLGQQTDCD